MHWLDQHSGSLTAIATAALVIITAIYVVLTRRLAKDNEDMLLETRSANGIARQANELTRETIQRELDERTQEQARLFTAWAPGGYNSSSEGVFVSVYYRNMSNEPIYNASFTLDYPRMATAHSQTIPTVVPAMNENGSTLVQLERIPDDQARPMVTATFTDNAGRTWHRDATSTLSRVENRDSQQ